MNQFENPRLRAIGTLLNENFFIPKYQRGYRWGKQEVTFLLDDICQYWNDGNPKGHFYCLQPVVVKAKEWKRDGETIAGWELIDGQQRITTLYIILSYLENIRPSYDDETTLFSIDFETRENCHSFFEEKKFKKDIDYSNVDFFHISKAFEYVEAWFQDKKKIRLDILRTILNDTNNVSIIWYEGNKTEDSIDLFRRLNEGKIPLTDSELIKALLLQADLYPKSELRFINQRLFEIASEWDKIEEKLQDEKVWFFINETDYQPAAKIEFLFQLLAEKWNSEKEEPLIKFDKEKPKNFEYLVFDRYLNEKRKSVTNKDDILNPVNEIWQEVKKIYSFLIEWYSDHILYHYIGFLFAVNPNQKKSLIESLLQSKKNKDEFIEDIKSKIGNSIQITEKLRDVDRLKTLSELVYGQDNRRIIKILLLFNVNTLLQSKKENARFPFHLYKKEKITSLEHIHPQNPEQMGGDKERCRGWLKLHIEKLKNLMIDKEKRESLQIKMEGLLKQFDKEEFTIIFNQIIDIYNTQTNFKEKEFDSLYNLALVDKNTNSQLNNSFFDVKREILKRNENGRYIPICTMRAFLKYYSESPKEMIFWDNTDRNSYFNAIQSVYNSFVKFANQ